MSNDADPVLLDVSDRIATITLNRPAARNALSSEVLRLLPRLMHDADASDDVDVLILTGADPAFCAGLDLKELGSSGGNLSGGGGADGSRNSTGTRGPFPKVTKPLIGAINGVAVTGGFELALNCDFLVASEHAKFGDTHARVGVMPGWGLTVLLPQAIGVRRAREMSFTGNFLSAEEALHFGLVNHVVPHAELLPFTRGLATDIIGNEQDGVRQVRATYAAIAHDDDAWEQEARDARAWQRTMFSPDKVAERRAAIPAARPNPVTSTRAAAWQEPGSSTEPVDGTPPARRRIGTTVALAAIVAVAAAGAIALHRNGHTQGDDFALYLRQARSLFDGDVAQVVADNRFTVINSGGVFSPIAYPWGWPLLLSPFVHLWGYDYDKLKLVEVAAFCVWLVLIHGIVRRRAGRMLALAVTAVVATAPVLLAHTDQLLSEFPHAAVMACFIWWMDRVKAERPLIAASGRQLVVLAVIAAAAYNVRREGVILIGVVLVVQLSELLLARRGGAGVPVPWRTVATPYVAFATAVIGFQLLLPSMLMPDSGDSPKYVPDRIGDYTSALTQQLGLARHPAIGVLVLLLALAGMAIGCVRRPRLDIPLAALTVLSAITVSTHFRIVGRYYFQILPWVLYFAAAAIAAAAGWLLRDRDGGLGRDRGRGRRMGPIVATIPLVYLVAVHVAVLPGDIDAARDFDRRGRPQIGPTDPTISPIFDAVQEHTAPTDVIAYFRARTLTLYTDRRTIQTTNIDRVLQRADYFAQMRFSDYYQPDVAPLEARALGLVEVWSDQRWILWRVPEPGDQLSEP